MCEQISLFDKLLQDPEQKPFIGTNVLFFLEGKTCPAIVSKHCGGDYFYIIFKERKPHDDNPKIADTQGWHISMRGYKEAWDYMG